MNTKNNLKNIRKAQGLTMDGLGDMCGISKSHVYSLEKGAEPRIGTAYAISKVLGHSVYDIWPDNTEVIEETLIVRRIVNRN